MTDLKVGDKVLRKEHRTGYHIGTIVEIWNGRATVAWATQRSRIKLTALVPTTEEECRQRAKEAHKRHDEEVARRFPLVCNACGNRPSIYYGRPSACPRCGGALAEIPAQAQQA